MDNTPSYAVLSERTGRFVRNRIRPADNSVRSLHHHVQTPQCRSARWPIKSVLPSRTSQHHTEGHAKVCWVIHTVVARSWAVSGRVIHNLQLSTICALLATVGAGVGKKKHGRRQNPNKATNERTKTNRDAEALICSHRCCALIYVWYGHVYSAMISLI